MVTPTLFCLAPTSQDNHGRRSVIKRKQGAIGSGGGGGAGRNVGKKKKGRKAAAAAAALAAQEEASLEAENPALARLARQQKVCVDKNHGSVECLIIIVIQDCRSFSERPIPGRGEGGVMV